MSSVLPFAPGFFFVALLAVAGVGAVVVADLARTGPAGVGRICQAQRPGRHPPCASPAGCARAARDCPWPAAGAGLAADAPARLAHLLEKRWRLGLPTQLDWDLPPGLQAGEIAWPVPQQIRVGDLLNYGYEGQVLLPVPTTVGARFRARQRWHGAPGRARQLAGVPGGVHSRRGAAANPPARGAKPCGVCIKLCSCKR